jgi:hypothetical protein
MATTHHAGFAAADCCAGFDHEAQMTQRHLALTDRMAKSLAEWMPRGFAGEDFVGLCRCR